MGRLSFILMLGCIVVLVACTSGKSGDVQYDNSLSPDLTVLIEKAIRRAVIDEKDIADYHLLKDKQKIVLSAVASISYGGSTEMRSYHINTAPQYQGVEIALQSLEGIQQAADTSGDFLYLAIDKIAITGDLATVTIVTRWAISQVNKEKSFYLSGGGYELQFVKHNQSWKFDKVLMSWSS